jgi:heat shock protein HslJ
MNHILLFISVMFTMFACSHIGTSSVDVNTLVGTEWVLVDLGGRGVEDRVQSTIIFEAKDRIVGWGGCNRYFSGYRSDGRNFQIGPIGSTRRVCPAVVMDQETRFFKSLEKAYHISMEGSALLIHSEGREKPLKFSRLKRTDS